MKFDEKERLSLLLQFQILDRLEPNGGWGKYVKVIQSGYESEYREIELWVASRMSTDECKFVADVLSMYAALQRPYADHKKVLPPDRKFPGFSGNEESNLLAMRAF
jgi:uncharacterized protein YfbU (UPF0304 family)